MRNRKHYWRKICAKCKRSCTYIRSNFKSFKILGIHSKAKILLGRHKRKSCLHHIVTEYNNKIQHRHLSRKGKNSYCIFGDISLASSIRSCSNRTKLLWDLLRTQLIRLGQALKGKRAHHYSIHEQIILIPDNARPNVAALIKTYLETCQF